MAGERPGESGNPPKVSVVIPCYNREAYIAQTVDSVLGQTWENIELVVVDDGSTDGSRDVLSGYGDRIRVMAHPGGENRGQSASINMGLKHTDGEYVAILDSDDYWMPEKIEKQARYLMTHPDVGLVYANGWIVDARGERQFRRYKPNRHRELNEPGRVLMDCYFALPSNALFRRSILSESGLFDESLRTAQDHDMAIRVAEHARLAYLPEELWCYRRHDDSVSHRSTLQRWRNGFLILERAAARYPYPQRVIRARRAVLHFRLGQCLLGEKRYLPALRHLAAAVFSDPGRALRVLAGREHVSAAHS